MDAIDCAVGFGKVKDINKFANKHHIPCRENNAQLTKNEKAQSSVDVVSKRSGGVNSKALAEAPQQVGMEQMASMMMRCMMFMQGRGGSAADVGLGQPSTGEEPGLTNLKVFGNPRPKTVVTEENTADATVALKATRMATPTAIHRRQYQQIRWRLRE